MRLEHIMRDTDLAFRERLARVRLLALDVDGVMTDGTLLYDAEGAESKRFHVRDGVGITLLRLAGIPTVLISGRKSEAVRVRAKELKIARIWEAARDKRVALTEAMQAYGLTREEVAFLGDDLNDLLAFEAVGVRLAVHDAAFEIKAAADAVTEACGGNGAVREAAEAILDAWGVRQQAVQRYLEMLAKEQEAAGQ